MWLLPRVLRPVFLGLARVRSATKAVLKGIRQISLSLYKALRLAVATLASAMRRVLVGIWCNGPVAFAVSLAVLCTLYKINRGEWILVPKYSSTAIAGASGLLLTRGSDFLATLPSAVGSHLLQVANPFVSLVAPMALSAAHGAAHVSSVFADDSIPLKVVLRSPGADISLPPSLPPPLPPPLYL